MSDNNINFNPSNNIQQNEQHLNQNNPQSKLEQMNNPQENKIKNEESSTINKLKGKNENDKTDKEQTRLNYELSIEYENTLRQQMEHTSPLISEELPINSLLDDYKSNIKYSNSIKQITDKYKYIRKVRRDGNCFYRSFIYRIFEYICMKNNKNLYEHVVKKITDSKDLIIRNGYDWAFIEDFYNIFYIEFFHCFNSLETKGVFVRDYLDNLFSDKEKGNYLIYFIRFCIAAFLKENSYLYEVYVELPFGEWISSEVESIDHEADQIQIMACVNYFDIGVRIEYLHPNKNEVVKFPEDKPDNQIFVTVLFTPGHYDLLYTS